MDDLAAGSCHYDRSAVERATRDSRELDACLARGRALPVLDAILVCELEPEPGQDEWDSKWACAVAGDVHEQARGAIFELLARAGRGA